MVSAEDGELQPTLFWPPLHLPLVFWRSVQPGSFPAKHDGSPLSPQSLALREMGKQDEAEENKVNMRSQQTGLAGLFPRQVLLRFWGGKAAVCSWVERSPTLTPSPSHPTAAGLFPQSPAQHTPEVPLSWA